jgi:hypothetical protein
VRDLTELVADRGLRKRWWEVWLIIVYYNNDQNVERR